MRIAWASLVAVGMVLVTIGCVTDHRRAQLVLPSTPKLRVSSIGIPGTYESSDGWLFYQLRLLPGGSGWIGFSFRLDPKETYVKPIEWKLSSDGFIELSGEGVAPAMGITAVPITLTRDGCCTWLEVTFFGVHANGQKLFYRQALQDKTKLTIEEKIQTDHRGDH